MRSNETTTLEPTLQPTLSPTFDPRPALEVIQTRPTSSRKLRCGFHVADQGKFRIEMCRAIAAVVLGDPSAYEILHPTSATRWTELDSRRLDLLLYSSHTVEREIREVCTVLKGDCLFELERVKSHSVFCQLSTQKGFAFSEAYYYAGKGEICNRRPNYTPLTPLVFQLQHTLV